MSDRPAYVLAKHQLGDVLPHGVVCTCGAELDTRNAPFSDATVKGEPLTLAFHQLHELRALVVQLGGCLRCAWCLADSNLGRRRGWELTCPHGYGSCRNCESCTVAPVAAASTSTPKENRP